MQQEYFVGLMSGTSLDGIDAALVGFSDGGFGLVASHYEAYDPEFRQDLHSICFSRSADLRELGSLDAKLGHLLGEAALRLLRQANVPAGEVRAIGSHGQTVFHHPHGAFPFTLQIGDPNRIAQNTGITTVADFRRRDIAVGGQGAPLVPAFHQAAFQQPDNTRVILNLGGIANLTVLPGTSSRGDVFGFDSGPANTLLDYWASRHLGTPMDEGGEWARSGRIDEGLLLRMLADPYFSKVPPKSTGQEYFSADWLYGMLAASGAAKAEDIQATLCQLTAQSVIQAIAAAAPDAQEVLVCGGGAHNAFLLERIRDGLFCPVNDTLEAGIHPDWVEAMAFAWLARQTLLGLPGNLPAVTGANRPVILGAIYPA